MLHACLLVNLPEEVKTQGPERHGHRRYRGSDRYSIHEAWEGSQRKHSPRPPRLSGGTQRTPDPDQLLDRVCAFRVEGGCLNRVRCCVWAHVAVTTV